MKNAIQEHNNKLQSDNLAVRNEARAKQFKINKTKKTITKKYITAFCNDI